MSRKVKRVTLVFVVALILGVMVGTVVNAASVEELLGGKMTKGRAQDIVNSNQKYYKKALIRRNSEGTNAPDGDFIEVTIDGDVYFVTEGHASSMVTRDGINKIDEIDVTANITDANEMVGGFTPVINLVIGILSWAIVIGLPLITSLDVMYITIPFFREKADGAKEKAGGKIWWISDEAQFAVENIDLEQGRSALKTYLTKRIGSFVMVAIVLYLLIGGQITVVTQLAVRLVSGIMSVLGGIAN